MNWFKQMISEEGGKTSIKRVLSVFFALLFTAVVCVHLTGVVVSEAIIWALVTLIGVPAAGGVIEKFRKNGNR